MLVSLQLWDLRDFLFYVTKNYSNTMLNDSDPISRKGE